MAKSFSQDEIASLHHWWSLAGVDLDYVKEPRSLLGESTQKVRQAANDHVASQNMVHEKTTDFIPKQIFPDNLNDFLEWLQVPENLIESNWARKFVALEGQADPEFMIISAMPEIPNQRSLDHFSPNSQQMVENILNILGARLEHCFDAPLALGRPTDGQIAKEYLSSLVERMLHLISLVQPKRIILFGDTVSRAFFDKDLLTARKKKLFINHLSSKTEAIVTFHPRILLERPELKAEAWKDLQQLTRIAKL
ncbi:MAG: hypothetical protein Pars2KO_31030 [Parasphingorhabdus sp.]